MSKKSTALQKPHVNSFNKVAQFLQALLKFEFCRRHLSASNLERLGIPNNLIKAFHGGTMFALVILLGVLNYNYFIDGNEAIAPRIAGCIAAILYVAFICFLLRRNHFKVAAWMLIALYVAIATEILMLWSINAQIGLLLLVFVIILAGTLLGPRYILPITAGLVALIAILQLLDHIGMTNPDTNLLSKNPSYNEVFWYGLIFSVFALMSWLSRRQMALALRRALSAEAALEEEKKLLAVRLEEQTKHLRSVQLEEMHQLYKFAELGQISTAVLHELANHLTILTLDIDDISERHQQSQAITHAKESLDNLDNMVEQVRRRLQESRDVQDINIFTVVDDTVASLRYKLAAGQINLSIGQSKKQPDRIVVGDPLVLSQIIAILLNNAIDATSSKNVRKPKITIDIAMKRSYSEIRISDNGSGISPEQQKILFEPFKSTKKDGMGIGLYIAKKMVDSHFGGSLALDPLTKTTTFVIELPIGSTQNKK